MPWNRWRKRTIIATTYTNGNSAIDHNLYVRGNRIGPTPDSGGPIVVLSPKHVQIILDAAFRRRGSLAATADGGR
jgi:hypothetical protein